MVHEKITEAQWAEFFRQKTTPKALALREANTRLAKMNKYPYHLGTGGYAEKVRIWRAEEEAARISGLSEPLEGCDERTINWMKGRKEQVLPDGKLTFPEQQTEEAASNILHIAEAQKAGHFKPKREKDQLSEGLGNLKHPGHVRGISSKMGRKEGFRQDLASYKDTLREQAREVLREKFKNMLSQQNPEFMQQLASQMFMPSQMVIQSSGASAS